MMKNLFKTGLIVFMVFALTGCTFILQSGRRSDKQKIEDLSQQLDDLTQAKQLLEDKLGKEISDKQVQLQMMEKGLVITVVGDLLFDSGKDKIRKEAYPLLNKVATALRDNMGNFNIGIEGYTDNVPIKHSNWKSNWELSSARSLSVLHYLIKNKDVAPERLSAIGFGEYRPIASNETREGRKLNRRVEIVIQPKITKIKEEDKSLPSKSVSSAPKSTKATSSEAALEKPVLSESKPKESAVPSDYFSDKTTSSESAVGEEAELTSSEDTLDEPDVSKAQPVEETVNKAVSTEATTSVETTVSKAAPSKPAAPSEAKTKPK